MSYLDLPRIYFAGRFFANPSTINNKLANYSPDVRLLPFPVKEQTTSVLEEYAGFQYINPYGLHNFYFTECVVTGFHTEDGVYLSGQPPLGIVASGTPHAKIVDLDPDQQSISQLFGLAINLQFNDGSGFQGPLEPTCLQDLWYGRVPNASMDQKAAGCFQSLIPLEKLTWRVGGSHSIIETLRKRCVTGVSIKFMLDAYQSNNKEPDFNYGRVIGIVGPGLPDEPIRFPAERRLNTGGSIFGPAYWKLDSPKRRVTIDLSNSVPLHSMGGESINAGALHAIILRDGKATPLHTRPLDYSRAALIGAGGIIDLPITADQCAELEKHPLGIQAVSPDGPPSLLLREDHSLTWINCDPTWLRLAPGQKSTVAFYARRAGKPLAGAEIDLGITRHLVNNRPRAGIQFPSKILTDERGRADLEISAHTPLLLPPRRGIIDSQVYYIGGSWQAAGELTRQSGGGALSVLAFNEIARVDAPTWIDHVEPIFSFYARLYPGISNILKLDSYDDIRVNAEIIRKCLLLPYEHPLHFPPSRDLAPERAQMICRWIEIGMPYE
jgi:hypothetical protein